MRIIAIIPARGGSKSLPKKNIIPLDGKPLLYYSIIYAKSNSLVEKTIVSTDSEEILNIAKENGAEAPFLRPKELALDSSRDYPFMRHAVDYFDNNNQYYDIYLLLRPTSPTRPLGLIERAIKIFKDNPNATSVRSVAKIKEHPYRSWSISSAGEMTGFIENIEEPYNIPRQELPSLYFQTGDIEAIRRETILNGSISGNHIYPLIINHKEMVDIDHLSDFKKAEERIREK